VLACCNIHAGTASIPVPHDTLSQASHMQRVISTERNTRLAGNPDAKHGEMSCFGVFVSSDGKACFVSIFGVGAVQTHNDDDEDSESEDEERPRTPPAAAIDSVSFCEPS